MFKGILTKFSRKATGSNMVLILFNKKGAKCSFFNVVLCGFSFAPTVFL